MTEEERPETKEQEACFAAIREIVQEISRLMDAAYQQYSRLVEQVLNGSKQFKRSPYEMEIIETIDFYGGKAAFVVSEYRATLGFVKRKTDAPVRVLQLAFYDEESGRAVVSSLIGNPQTVRKNEEALRELVFSVACRSPQLSLL